MTHSLLTLATTRPMTSIQLSPRHRALARSLSLLFTLSLSVVSPLLGQVPDSTAQSLPGVRVTSGSSAKGFVERTSDVGLGFPAELRKVPASVHVISRQLIEEQRPVSLSEIVRNTSGVSAARNGVEVFRSFKLRGFSDSTRCGQLRVCTAAA